MPDAVRTGAAGAATFSVQGEAARGLHRSCDAEAVIGILECRRDARSRRAPGYLDVVPPRSATRCAAAALLRPLWVPLRAALVIMRVVPVRAPLVNIIAHIEQPVRVRRAEPHTLRAILPTARVA